MSAPVIRDAGPADREAWLTLWQGYLEFYGAGLDDAVTAMTWNRIIDPVSAVFTRLALVDGEVAGFATCILHPRTWAVEPACYLEDLFVDPERRGSGIGRALRRALCALCRRLRRGGG